jgi:hypothetical protein
MCDFKVPKVEDSLWIVTLKHFTEKSSAQKKKPHGFSSPESIRHTLEIWTRHFATKKCKWYKNTDSFKWLNHIDFIRTTTDRKHTSNNVLQSRVQKIDRNDEPNLHNACGILKIRSLPNRDNATLIDSRHRLLSLLCAPGCIISKPRPSATFLSHN